MSNTPAPTPAAGEPTYVKAFFATGKDKKERVALFLDPKNPDFVTGRPAMFGTIDGKSVSVFIEPGGEKEGKAYGPFLTINERGAKNADGSYEKDTRFAVGNIRVTEEGAARLAIKFQGQDETLWATPRKEVSNDLLAKAGLDLEKLASARAAQATKVANDPEKKTAAPKAA